MSQTDYLYLFLALFCILVSAFFSSSETAYVSLQRVRLKHMENSGVPRAGRVARLMEKPERFLTTVLLGNNFVNTAAAALGTAVALSLLRGNERLAVLVATIVVTLVLLIVGEIMPKIAASQHNERMALIYIQPLTVIAWLLTPFVAVLERLGTGFSRLIGGEPLPRSLITEEEIRTMISVGKEEGVVEEAEAKMLHKVFEFGDHPVHEAMIPRPSVIWIEKGTSLHSFLEIYTQTPHTRFPVYEETPDNVVGMISVKDLLLAQAQGRMDEDNRIDDLIRPIIFVPESKKIGQLFGEMREAGVPMAIVVDEWGGIDGMVTTKQLLEQIVGHFGDELVRQVSDYEAIDEYTFDVDGNMRIEEVNEELHLGIPEGDYETIAGFVLSRLGHIPQEGARLRFGELHFLVKEMRNLKIEKLRITKEIRQ